MLRIIITQWVTYVSFVSHGRQTHRNCLSLRSYIRNPFAGIHFSGFRSLILLVACSWQLAGCLDSADRLVNVPDSTLAKILADLHVESAALQLATSRDSLLLGALVQEDVTSSRDSVLAAYGLSETEFMNAMEPYIKEPSRYVALYNQVLDRLNQKRQRVGQDELSLE